MTQPASGTGLYNELYANNFSFSDHETFDNTTGASDTIHTNNMSDPEQQTSEPKNVKDDAPQDDDVQHAEQQGRDPNTEGPDHPKMTGTGAPGSHSAFFGLTPDGKRDENTQAGSTPVKPAHSKETSNTEGASGGGSYSNEDSGSRGATGSGVAEQVSDLHLLAIFLCWRFPSARDTKLTFPDARS